MSDIREGEEFHANDSIHKHHKEQKAAYTHNGWACFSQSVKDYADGLKVLDDSKHSAKSQSSHHDAFHARITDL